MKTAKEIGIAGVFVALLIGVQFALSFVAGIELVTVLVVSYCYYFGVKRGLITMCAFSLIRCLIFGFMPNVIVLYLVFYSLIALLFGFLGNKMHREVRVKNIVIVTVVALIATCSFTLMDDVITPLITGMSANGYKVYFLSSLPVMLKSIINAAVTVPLLFFPLEKLFKTIKL